MDVRAFGMMVVFLAVILGIFAGFYAMQPYEMRDAYMDALYKATMIGESTPEFISIQQEIESLKQRASYFGIAAAITGFLGIALIISAKKPAPANE